MNNNDGLRRLAALCSMAIAAGALAQGPSFDCGRVKSGGIEARVCGDADLAALDRRLAEVYAQAVAKAKQPAALKAEQRGWIKGRDDCWKNDDERACVDREYRRRIAELQARHRLVAAIGPISYVCDGDAANAVVAIYFETEPATLIAEYHGAQSLMYQQLSASGARYAGRNESLWEHQGEARITWGYQAPEMVCKKMPAS